MALKAKIARPQASANEIETLQNTIRFQKSRILALQEELGERGTITSYEELKTNFEVEVRRLAAFIGVDLPQAKFDALAAHVSFDSMLGRDIATMRKGMVGDFEEHLTPGHWAEVDAAFTSKWTATSLWHTV